MTREQLKARFPNASESFLRANAVAMASGLQASQPERAEKRSLECVAQGETTRPARFALSFTCFSRKPLDADNGAYKPLQDCIVIAGYLVDDDWRHLGQVTTGTEKVYEEEEEGTLIKLTQL